MALIPLFKNYTREELTEDFELEFGISEWVSIDFPYTEIKELDQDIPEGEAFDGDEVAYESNRYDVKYYDPLADRTISVYMYLDENSYKVLAIDSTVQDADLNVQYDLLDTPLVDVLRAIQAKQN